MFKQFIEVKVPFNVKLNFTLEQNFTDIYVDALRVSNVMKIIPELYDTIKNNDKIMLCNKTIDIKLICLKSVRWRKIERFLFCIIQCY